MLSPIRNLFTPPFHLEKPDRRRVISLVLYLSFLVVGAVLILAMIAATQVVAAELPAWDIILLARLALGRLVLACPVTLLAVGGALVVFHAFSHSEAGRTLMTWDPDDSPEVKARKTGNGGLILASLLLAFVLGLLGAILR